MLTIRASGRSRNTHVRNEFNRETQPPFHKFTTTTRSREVLQIRAQPNVQWNTRNKDADTRTCNSLLSQSEQQEHSLEHSSYTLRAAFIKRVNILYICWEYSSDVLSTFISHVVGIYDARCEHSSHTYCVIKSTRAALQQLVIRATAPSFRRRGGPLTWWRLSALL